VFGNIPKIRRHAETLADVGLDTCRWPAGADAVPAAKAAARKVAAELGRPNTGRTLYISTSQHGLHFATSTSCSSAAIASSFGNTVIVVEHNSTSSDGRLASSTSA